MSGLIIKSALYKTSVMFFIRENMQPTSLLMQLIVSGRLALFYVACDVFPSVCLFVNSNIPGAGSSAFLNIADIHYFSFAVCYFSYIIPHSPSQLYDIKTKCWLKIYAGAKFRQQFRIS